MTDIKIVFFDIDGTLIDMKKKCISEKTLETLRRLKEKGIRICVATGRSPMQVPRFPGVEFDAFLTYNGSYCFDRHQDIFSNPLRREDVRTLIKNAAGLGRPVSVATKSRLAANGADQDLTEYYGFGGLDLEIADDFDAVAEQEEIYQLMLGCRKEDYTAILEGTRAAKIAAWWDRAVDIIPSNGGKGIAIDGMLDFYHLSKEEAMAFGDGNNDIEMLQAVGHGIAMQNASEELKAAADEVCGDVAEDGIYFYCKEHGLI